MDRRDFLRDGLAVAGGIGSGSLARGEATPPVAPSESSATVHDLREAPTEPGRVVLVQGRDAPGDGGGGLFLWSRTRAPSNLDAGTNRAENALWVRSERSQDGFWFRVLHQPSMNVRWFGAKGDGEADDAKAIQDAVFVAGYLDVRETYLPEGAYRIESPIVIPWTSGQTLEGQGTHSTTIARAGTDTYTTRLGSGNTEVHAAIVVPVAKDADGGYADANDVRVANLNVEQREVPLERQRERGADTPPYRVGLFIESVYRAEFENLRIDGFHTAVLGTKVWMSRFNRIHSSECVRCLYFPAPSEMKYAAASTSLVITNCYCDTTVLGDAYTLALVFYSTIKNCGADAVEGWPYRIRTSKGVTVTGCGFEKTLSGKGILFEGTTGVVSSCKSIGPRVNTRLDERVGTLAARSYNGTASHVTVMGSHFGDLLDPSGGAVSEEEVDAERNAGLVVDDSSEVFVIGSRFPLNAPLPSEGTAGELKNVHRFPPRGRAGGGELADESVPDLAYVRDEGDVDAINENFERLRRAFERLAGAADDAE